ncbi:universal stress protein [Ruegeria sp. EL01]|uniref:universal stress protein n=1 Tax=Ruegeria sp. EL01 TaxID=2107578 RepID=UPI0013C49FFD|nr:universal stress protein [Ruegeria sp. EL01]
MAPNTVLVLVDIAHHDSGKDVLSYAAAAFPSATLHAAYVMPYGFYSYVEPFVSDESQKAANTRAKEELAALVAAANVQATPHVLRGGIGEQAMLEAKAINADLIVLNAVRPGSALSTLGTHAAQIARHAKASVLLHR